MFIINVNLFILFLNKIFVYFVVYSTSIIYYYNLHNLKFFFRFVQLIPNNLLRNISID